jgi:hypothetical protein
MIQFEPLWPSTHDALICQDAWLLSQIVFFVTTLGSCLVLKNFQDSPSNRMFGHMHEALNVDEKKQLHSLVENHEMNLLSLISL